MSDLKVKTENVFKTEGFPEYTFISPPDFDNILIDMRAPHKPIVFEGASGTGKTSTIKAAIQKCGFSQESIKIYSARSPADRSEISDITINGKLKYSITVVDDFHRLDSEVQVRLSDMLRLMADDPGAINGKLIIAGINEVGHRLIAVSDDLLKRMAIHRIRPADRDEAFAALSAGADKLNVNINNLLDLIDESQGDYWTIQKLCQQAMIQNKVFETVKDRISFSANIEKLRSEIIGQLHVQFGQLMKDFIRGVRFRKTNRAYFHLIKTFGKVKSASIALNELAIRYPEEKARFDQIKRKRLPELIKAKNEVSKKFFYDPETTIFSVEDPALAYFVQNIDWDKFAETAGFPTQGSLYDFEIGISFAGEQRDLARRLADAFEEDDISSFYDEYQDLLGKDLEVALESAYAKKSQYVVAIISKEYKEKIWTSFERGVWSVRVNEGAILPVFIDDIIIKEVSTSLGRIDFSKWRSFYTGGISEEEFIPHFKVLYERITKVLENR